MNIHNWRMLHRLPFASPTGRMTRQKKTFFTLPKNIKDTHKCDDQAKPIFVCIVVFNNHGEEARLLDYYSPHQYRSIIERNRNRPSLWEWVMRSAHRSQYDLQFEKWVRNKQHLSYYQSKYQVIKKNRLLLH